MNESNIFSVMKKKAMDASYMAHHEFEDYIDGDTGDIVSIGKGKMDKDKYMSLLNGIIEEYRPELIDKPIKFRKNDTSPKMQFFIIKDIKAEYSQRLDYPYIVFYAYDYRSGFRKETELKSRHLVHGVYEITTEDEISVITGWKVDVYKDGKKDLYILRNETGRIKIGRSKNIQERVKNLSNAAGLKIEIIRYITGGGHLETKLHYYFKRNRYIGEWFDLSESQIKFLLDTDLELFFRRYTNK